MIICGGDGTVMWVISELSRHGIDHRRTPLAIVPLGTGNDFSRNLGWGKSESSLLENNFAGLKQLVVDCLAAGEEWFDLWDV